MPATAEGSKVKLIRYVLLWTPAHGHNNVGPPPKTYIHDFCADTGCCQENLPRAMEDKDRWWEKV